MNTYLEKQLWLLLYKSQVALAKRVLEDANATEGAKSGEWPCGSAWHQLGGSSQGTLLRTAREIADIDREAYLWILCSDDDAYDIAEEELDAADNLKGDESND